MCDVSPTVEEAACLSRRESGGTLTSPTVSNPESAGNTLTYGSSTPLLLVEAALNASGSGEVKNTRDTIGREVGAGVTADVGGVGVMLQVSGCHGRSGSSHHSRPQSPDKDDWEPIIRQR
ncbi:hypothetical protein FHG87_021348 [Trinorchestia longiramus]|nr:hypothetical protein FHG87_021348 [Trinorchestia longiramus]